MLTRIRLLVWLCVVVSIHTAAQTAHVDYSKTSVDELIDELTLLDSQTSGIDSAAIFGGFIGDDTPGQFQMGILGAPPPKVPPQMRELVRRGADALPELIAHLDDARPTNVKVGDDDRCNDRKQKCAVGLNVFMFMVFSDEYDPRVRSSSPPYMKMSFEKPFEGKYIVKVGDVCYVLIGQIVNRNLLAVRYQPTAGLIVNSPIEAPGLVQRVKADWGKTDAEALKASLLADIRAGKRLDSYESAFTRLRFYYPDTYGTLQGADRIKRNNFEAHGAKAE